MSYQQVLKNNHKNRFYNSKITYNFKLNHYGYSTMDL